ncbi:MAG TPA: GYD domain-containing protein [Candidatus Polarisedimenticolaceae bacterium]|nr:GYD domain-containing protein [Candidatus Polarisedimenticolaceae bacterium]
MPTYVLMTRLAPDSLHDARGRRAVGKSWLEQVRKACPDVEWLAHYAILGPYDFMDIYRAPDEETAHKVSLISRSAGAVTAESWGALPYDRYLLLLEQVRPD